VSEILSASDLVGLWDDNEYSLREYVDVPVTSDTVALVERELGFKLPAAYVWLSRTHNGGWLKRSCHRTAVATSWAADHVALSGIYSIGFKRRCSLLGECGSRFWHAEWGYPEIGVYFADCPSAGHDMFCLDYRRCGPEGEPSVVHVDQEFDYAITEVANSFASFIRGLEPSESFSLEEIGS
jgi:hypothetical protein